VCTLTLNPDRLEREREERGERAGVCVQNKKSLLRLGRLQSEISRERLIIRHQLAVAFFHFQKLFLTPLPNSRK
jgi:hypothetical protein